MAFMLSPRTTAAVDVSSVTIEQSAKTREAIAKSRAIWIRSGCPCSRNIPAAAGPHRERGQLRRGQHHEKSGVAAERRHYVDRDPSPESTIC